MKRKSIMGILSALTLVIFAILPVNSTISKAADAAKVYNLAVCYFSSNVDPIHYYKGQLDENPADEDYYISGYDNMITVNVQCSLSTSNIGAGTVITLTGIPNDCINFMSNELYTVGISEGQSFTEYGRWLPTISGKNYSNGTLSYTVKNSNEPITITFGYWHGGDDGGFDTSYTINPDGTIEGGCYCELNEDYGYGFGFNNHLETFILNDNTFNAFVYYMCNKDIQTVIGSNPQDLYNHWITVGKAEGRRAI